MTASLALQMLVPLSHPWGTLARRLLLGSLPTPQDSEYPRLMVLETSVHTSRRLLSEQVQPHQTPTLRPPPATLLLRRISDMEPRHPRFSLLVRRHTVPRAPHSRRRLPACRTRLLPLIFMEAPLPRHLSRPLLRPILQQVPICILLQVLRIILPLALITLRLHRDWMVQQESVLRAPQATPRRVRDSVLRLLGTRPRVLRCIALLRVGALPALDLHTHQTLQKMKVTRQRTTRVYKIVAVPRCKGSFLLLVQFCVLVEAFCALFTHLSFDSLYKLSVLLLP